MAKFVKITVFFAVGLFIMYLVFDRQNAAYTAECSIKGIAAADCHLMDKIMADIKGANYFWVVLTMILFMITNVFRALRWQMMFNAIGYRPKFINLIGTIMINYLANLGIPRSGEVIRAGMISRYENIPLEKSLGTIFTDRIFDVIMLALVILLAILIGGNDFESYLETNADITGKLTLVSGNYLLLISLAVLGLGLVFGMWMMRDILLKSVIGQRIKTISEGFISGVKSVSKVRSIPLFIFYTVGIWLLYYLMMYFGFRAFAPTAHLGMVAGLVIFVFGSLGILVPTPGGMGSYHYLVGVGLALYGINGADAFSFANIIFFSINIFINVIFGLAALVILPTINDTNNSKIPQA